MSADRPAGLRCEPGKVTRGCECVACADLRDARMTYKQKRRRILGRRAAAAAMVQAQDAAAQAAGAAIAADREPIQRAPQGRREHVQKDRKTST